MSIIKISGLTFGYEGSFENVFEDVSLNLDTDWKTGFIGRNGRGKTTFLRLLMGEFEYRGSINASVEFEYFPYMPSDENEAVMDIVREISGAQEWQICREISLLGAREDILYRPFFTLSMGERTKCLLAAMFLKENSFLLIDEPTNHLDGGGRETLAEYLRGKRGFILVSHDRMFLDRTVDHVISINRNDIEVMRGNFSVWEEERRRRDEYELAENEKLKKEIKALEKSAKRAAEWSANAEGKKKGLEVPKFKGKGPYYGEKARKAAARAKAFESRAANALEEKSKLLKNIEKSDDLKICGLRYHSDLICRVEHFSLMYGGDVCKDVSFEVHRGDRLRLTGGNGCGKSSVLRAICGEDVPYEGRVSLGSGVIISRVEQDAEGLGGSLREYADSFDIDYSLFLTILRKLDFGRSDFELPLEALSCGQRKKVSIARSLCQRAHLYIWDEPLNFVDVLSRMQIERLVMEYSPTLIFVEHDGAFGDRVGTGEILINN